jgi:lysozyme family protein
MYLDANRGNLNTFFDQIDNICLLYSIKLQSLSSFTHFSNSIYSNFLRIKISA